MIVGARYQLDSGKVEVLSLSFVCSSIVTANIAPNAAPQTPAAHAQLVE